MERGAVPAFSRPKTAADLLAREFLPPRYAVEGLIVEGLSLLVGKPKLGKSWLGLAMSVAVAAGGYVLGTLRAEQGEALYLALEDGDRRLQGRLRAVLGDAGAPAGWHYVTAWPTLDEGGIEMLQEWLTAHPQCRLVVIDTFKRVRPKERGNLSAYGQDYDALVPLADLARAYRLALVAVHHTRKAAADDVLDTVNGSTGLAAAADAVLVLQRARGQVEATLSVTGRDIEERELALRFDPTLMAWTLVGDAEVLRREREDAGRRADDDWLRAALADGPRWSVELLEAAKAVPIGRNRLFEAKERIGARAVKDGRNRWQWVLEVVEAFDVVEPFKAIPGDSGGLIAGIALNGSNASTTSNGTDASEPLDQAPILGHDPALLRCDDCGVRGDVARLYDGGDGRRRCHAHALLAPGTLSALVAGTGVAP